MRVWMICTVALTLAVQMPLGAQQEPSTHSPVAQNPGRAAAAPPMSDEEKANLLSDQVGKLMVKCVNLLTAQDPLSLNYCKQQRDLAEQYPPGLRIMDKLLAHDEYGIALAAFDRKREALAEFNREVALLPKVVHPGAIEWSTAYWHRAMIYTEIGDDVHADRDYREAEYSFRKQERQQAQEHPGKKMKTVLRQHAALLKKEGKTGASQKLLAEAEK